MKPYNHDDVAVLDAVIGDTVTDERDIDPEQMFTGPIVVLAKWQWDQVIETWKKLRNNRVKS